jgi:hypothetical protein
MGVGLGCQRRAGLVVRASLELVLGEKKEWVDDLLSFVVDRNYPRS